MTSPEWEASQIAASLTTYIVGIEQTLKQPMLDVVAYLITLVGEVYATLEEPVSQAIAHGTVNLPGESKDDAA